MATKNPFWCMHSRYSEPDETGASLCLDCGAIAHQKLTRDLLIKTFEQMRRHSWHSMRCVETEDGWCCASDCPSAQARA